MGSTTATKVVEAASRLFAERGYQATTTRVIAEAAGVNEVTLFRTFGNKQGVLRAILQEVARAQAGHRVAELGPADVRATLLALAEQEVANGLAAGGLVTRLAFEAASVPEVAELFAGGPESNLRGLTEYLAQAQAAGHLRADVPARTIAEAFFALTSSFVITRTVLGGQVEDPAALERTVADLFQLFWCGAAPAEDPEKEK
jgi:AcrR family transcriptional regulator